MRVVQMNPFSSRPGSFTQPRTSAPPALSLPVAPSSPFDIKSFKKDDWILLGIIAVLIMEGSDDYILLCALGYLFLVGL